MDNDLTHIHPNFDRYIGRAEKEALLGQRGLCVWLTGLSGSGKTTIAAALESMLHDAGYMTRVLDGDDMRTGLCNDLGFSEQERTENIRRVAEVARLFVECGIVTICAFVSPADSIRSLARETIGADDFLGIYVSTSLELCEQRDVKGLYRKARSGQIGNLSGLNAPFEKPQRDFVDVPTAQRTPEDCARQILLTLNHRIVQDRS